MDYIEEERDALRKRINDPEIHIEFLKKILSGMETNNPHRGHIHKTLKYLVSRTIK